MNIFDNITATPHAVCEASLLKATGIGHIYSLQCEKDYDNGSIVAVGDWVKAQVYKTKDYAAGAHPVLILTVPEGYNTASKAYTEERWFYNAKGELARGYELYVGDIYTLSENAFNGTPAVGKFIDATNTVAAAAGNNFAAEIVEKVTYQNSVSYRVAVRSLGV